MIHSKQAVYHKMDDEEAVGNVELPDIQEGFTNFKQDPPRMNSTSAHGNNEHIVLNLADQAVDSFWAGYHQVCRVIRSQTGAKPQLKKIEGDGAESEEEFEYAEGVTVSSAQGSPRSHEQNQVSNRRATNRWSSLMSAEDHADMTFTESDEQKVE